MKKDYFVGTIVLLLLFGFPLREIQAQELPNLKNPTSLDGWYGKVGIKIPEIYGLYMYGKKFSLSDTASTPTFSSGFCINTDKPDNTSHRFKVFTSEMGNGGYDVNVTGDSLPVVPNNFTSSIRVGNSCCNSEAEGLYYKLAVTNDNALLTVHYALVMSAPWHADEQNPEFVIRVEDTAGNLLNEAMQVRYSFDRNDTIKWGTSNAGNIDEIAYKRWSTFTVNLNEYIGDSIVLGMLAGDCSYTGHFGYAYIAVDYSPFTLEVEDNIESMDTIASIKAPEGMSGYQWYIVTPDGKIKIEGERGTNIIFYSLNEDFDLVLNHEGQLTYECEIISSINGENPSVSHIDVVVKNRKPQIRVNKAHISIVGKEVRLINETFAYGFENEYNRIDESKTWWDMGDGTVYTTHSEVSHQYSTEGKKYVLLHMETVGGYKTEKLIEINFIQSELKNPTDFSGYTGAIGYIRGEVSSSSMYVEGIPVWDKDLFGAELDTCESVEGVYYGIGMVKQRGLEGGEYYKRFEIVSQGMDPNTCNQLSTTPPDTSFTHAIRVGNTMNSEMEKLSYEFVVTDNNQLLSIWYAFVSENPVNPHGYRNPMFDFSLRMKDNEQWIIRDSSLHRNIIISDNAQNEWGTEPCQGEQPILYKPWEKIIVNLDDYVGDTIRLEVINRDCLATGHFSYCYFAAECVPFTFNVEDNNDITDTVVFIEAPEGFDEYQWYVTDSNTKAEKVAIQGERGKLQRLPVLEDDFILYSKKGAKLEFECELTSFMNPAVPNKSSVSVEVLNRKPWVEVETLLEDNYTVSFINESFLHVDEDIDEIDESKTRWDMGDGTVYTQHSDIIHQYASPGVKRVTLYVETKEGYKSQKVFSVVVSTTSSIDTPDNKDICLKRNRNNYEIVLANEKTIKQIEIYDVSGKLHKIVSFNDKKGTFKIEKSGIFLMKIVTTDGQSIFEKIPNF